MTKAEQQQNREVWRNRVDDFRASGLSGAAWCAAQGIKPHLLYYWTQQFSQTEMADADLHWQTVVVSDRHTNSPESKVQIRIGRTIIEISPGFDAKLLGEVVRLLATVC